MKIIYATSWSHLSNANKIFKYDFDLISQIYTFRSKHSQVFKTRKYLITASNTIVIRVQLFRYFLVLHFIWISQTITGEFKMTIDHDDDLTTLNVKKRISLYVNLLVHSFVFDDIFNGFVSSCCHKKQTIRCGTCLMGWVRSFAKWIKHRWEISRCQPRWTSKGFPAIKCFDGKKYKQI